MKQSAEMRSALEFFATVQSCRQRSLEECLLDILSESLRGKKDTDGFLGPSFSESDVELRYRRAQSCLVTIFSLSASEEDMQVTV